MKFSKCLTGFALAALILPAAYAHNSATLSKASQSIANLQSVLAAAKKNTDVPVLFPHLVPQNNNAHYYAYLEPAQTANGADYVIDIDSTVDCHGAHYCNIGSVRAERGGNPQLMYNMQNQEITVAVQLDKQQKAYFTPSHAMADNFPAQIQWRAANILYTISWDTNQAIMIAMANSTIKKQ